MADKCNDEDTSADSVSSPARGIASPRPNVGEFWRRHPEYGSALVASLTAIVSAALASWWTSALLTEQSAREERSAIYLEYKDVATDLSRILADYPAFAISSEEVERVQADGDRAVIQMGDRLERLLFQVEIYGTEGAYKEASDVFLSMPITEMYGNDKVEVKQAYKTQGFEDTQAELDEFESLMCSELPAKRHSNCGSQ